MNNRRLKWTSEDDQILYETVMEYVSNGDTKASAFKKASQLLSRTVGACRHRWNAEVKHLEQSPIETETKSILHEHEEITLNDCVRFLQESNELKNIEKLLAEQEILVKEQEALRIKSAKLEEAYENKRHKYNQALKMYEAMAGGLLESNDIIGDKEKKAVH
ncbi:Myb-like DNA-binding domain-containing protein [Bacillus dakarensis]|uniref:Myb-like DNA-binding domain-containing protein n=1 Tax=Robertmurraya dakarensis TaxID=1926278 RepID=UPI000981101B|nr:Myb-like DNA-binding domain-containing protein [Bacillus dakarensis]